MTLDGYGRSVLSGDTVFAYDQQLGDWGGSYGAVVL